MNVKCINRTRFIHYFYRFLSCSIFPLNKCKYKLFSHENFPKSLIDHENLILCWQLSLLVWINNQKPYIFSFSVKQFSTVVHSTVGRSMCNWNQVECVCTKIKYYRKKNFDENSSNEVRFAVVDWANECNEKNVRLCNKTNLIIVYIELEGTVIATKKKQTNKKL